MRRLSALAFVLTLALAGAAPVSADTYCAGGSACPDGLQAALEKARNHPGADRVEVAAGEVAGGVRIDDPGPLEVVGGGAAATGVTGAVRLTGAEVVLSGLTVRDGTLEVAGRVVGVRVTGGGVRAATGRTLTLDSVQIDGASASPALDAPCARLVARHVTVSGGGAVGARAACARGPATLSLRSSIVAGYARSLRAGGDADDRVSAAFSSLSGTADGTVTDRAPADPGFVSATDLRLRADSPLLERGDPAPLEVDKEVPPDTSEPGEDLDGALRVADADGDGVARRDVGAHERPPQALSVPAQNVLVNPDAEAAGSGAPPGWLVTEGFTAESYGVAPFPSASTGAALGAGARFFAGGLRGAQDATAAQIVDLAARDAAIDAGAVRATLSGLLGGYRADADEPSVTASFRGPSGVTLGRLALGPVDAAARGNATGLLARSASAVVPPLTRSVQVTLTARAASGSYADAYFDTLGLVLAEDPSFAGGRGDGGSGGSGGAGGAPSVRPFAGLLVLSGRATLRRSRGTARLLVGCASPTVARCTGNLALQAVLARGTPRVGIGTARVSLAPGRAARVGVRVSRAARRYLRRHTKLRVRVRTSAVDGQGLRRATAVPIVVRPSRRR